MSTRLDIALRKHPEHETGIRLLASRDPSGNFKYLDWGVKVLVSKQALAPEISDVLDLFHRFNGRIVGNGRSPSERVRSDIYTYRPQDLATLRDKLLKLKRVTDSKRRKRELLYRIEGEIEAEVIYHSTDLIVRHIKNKQASVHYGLGTKWCISMLREGYFEDYETHNATFFFFERTVSKDDEFDKVALMIPRGGSREETAEAFTALDHRVDMMVLANIHGPCIFDIFRDVYGRSKRHPNSDTFQVYSGKATKEQLEATFAVISKMNPHEAEAMLESVCCNDAAPWSLLEEILLKTPELIRAAWKRKDSLGRRARSRFLDLQIKELTRVVTMALVIHPNTPSEVRQVLTKKLRGINVDLIGRSQSHDGRVAVSCESSRYSRHGGRRRRRRYRRQPTVELLRKRARTLARMAARAKKAVTALRRKIAKKKKEIAARQRRKKKRRTAERTKSR